MRSRTTRTALGDFGPQISRGYHESGAKKEGLITIRSVTIPEYWSEVILKGVQIGLATPIFKSPTANSNDSVRLDLTSACRSTRCPRRSIGARPTSHDIAAAQDRWVDRHDLARKHAYTEFYRLAWRRQIAPNTERSLFAAIIPPGPAHVDPVHSLALADNRETALAAGFWASFRWIIFVRMTGRSDLQSRTRKSSALRLAGSSSGARAPAPHAASELPDRPLTRICGLSYTMTLGATRPGPCNWAGLPPLASRPDLGARHPAAHRDEHAGPLSSRSTPWSRSGSAWTSRRLIAIYQRAFPVLERLRGDHLVRRQRLEARRDHRTRSAQTRHKEHWEQFQAYTGGSGEEPAAGRLHGAVLQGGSDRRVPAGACGV